MTFNELFASLNVPASISKALTSLNFTTPTPIQEAAIPVAFTGRDLIGCAQTGTGKTAAFSIPTLTHLMKSPGKTALVLVPTRELATQIEEFWKSLTKFSPGMHCVSLIGGMPMHGQMKQLHRRPRLFIATPGRLVDHLQRGSVKLDQVEILILDEADRMLDMGFAPQLSQILKYLPVKRQTLFFSATWTKVVDGLSSKYLQNPARVSVGTTNQAAPKIRQSTIETTQQKKNDMLLDELNRREGSVLVFARTQARTDRVARYLSTYGLEVARIHGGRTQAQRNSALQNFRTGKSRILIATDIAARGIDVTGIGHVINYDLPQVPEDYVHRIGRTGRAGAEGEAVSFVTPEERLQWRAIARLLERRGGGDELPEGIPNPRQSRREEPRRDPRENRRRDGRRQDGRNRDERQVSGERSRPRRGEREKALDQKPAVKPLFGIIG